MMSHMGVGEWRYVASVFHEGNRGMARVHRGMARVNRGIKKFSQKKEVQLRSAVKKEVQ